MSYMDRKNILSEGFFDLFKRLPKQVRDANLSSAERRLYKSDPKFRKKIDDFLKDHDKLMKYFKSKG